MKKIQPEFEGDNDKRMLIRKLYNGEISKEKFDRYLAELPDVSACAEEVVIE